MMNSPFDDVMDDMDAASDNAAGDDGFSDDGFTDENQFTDEFEDASNSFSATDSMGDGAEAESDNFDNFEGYDSGDSFDASADGDSMSAWDAFEDEIADGLDAADTDEFLSRILGGLGRAAGALSRSGALGRAGQMAGRVAGRVGQAAGRVGQVAGRVAPVARGVGQAAGGASQIAGAAANLARALGSQTWANRLNQAGNVAGRVGQVANQVGNMAGRVQGAAQGLQNAGNNPGQMLSSVLGSLFGQGFDEFEAFDQLVDAYDGDDIDEALPALVGLAARGVARGLGMNNVSQLAQNARRALVRGVASAARELVSTRGPNAARALPAVARAATRAVRRRGATPAQAPQQLRRQLPQTARRVAQTPRLLNQVAARRASPRTAQRGRSIARPNNLGRGAQSGIAYNPQRIVFSGPVELIIQRT